ncbi:hypothetical protein [Microbacterium elymi]|uniref:hypothetical protein n=1 Tax=Microbacterium elymi TaxID=2909587 RepID=UPI0033905FD9
MIVCDGTSNPTIVVSGTRALGVTTLRAIRIDSSPQAARVTPSPGSEALRLARSPERRRGEAPLRAARLEGIIEPSL